jgi:hypothetical protein
MAVEQAFETKERGNMKNFTRFLFFKGGPNVVSSSVSRVCRYRCGPDRERRCP